MALEVVMEPDWLFGEVNPILLLLYGVAWAGAILSRTARSTPNVRVFALGIMIGLGISGAIYGLAFGFVLIAWTLAF